MELLTEKCNNYLPRGGSEGYTVTLCKLVLMKRKTGLHERNNRAEFGCQMIVYNKPLRSQVGQILLTASSDGSLTLFLG